MYVHPITQTSEKKQLYITNGQLFNILWKGDQSVLDSSHLPVEPPKMTIKLTQDLSGKNKEKSTIALEKVMDRFCTLSNEVNLESPNLFILPFDPIFDLLVRKSNILENGLAKEYMFKIEDLKVSEFELTCNKHFPTAKLRCFMIDSSSPDKVEKFLQNILKAVNSTSEKALILSRHGRFVPFTSTN